MATPDKSTGLQRRIDELEWENRRLREATESAGLTPEVAAWFDPKAFQKAMGRFAIMVQLPAYALGALLMMAGIFMGLNQTAFTWPGLPPVPLFDLGRGSMFGVPGIGVGIIATGGAAVGLFAFGGIAVGGIAVGGGAVGIVAMGGGACGVFAYGGGSVGYISIGGGAVGVYAMGGKGIGRHVLAMNRQDESAAYFFRRFIPGLGAAVSKPMPVIFAESV